MICCQLRLGQLLNVYPNSRGQLCHDLAAPDKRDSVSSRGWAFGYAGGGLLLLLNLVLYAGYETFGVTQGEAVRISLMPAGATFTNFIKRKVLRFM